MTSLTDRHLAVGDLRDLVRDLFAAVGVPGAAAEEVAEALVRADQAGQPSHGVMMAELYIRRILGGSVSTHEAATLVSDRGATAVLDARHALGQPVARQAMDLACDKAAAFGIGAVAVRRAFHFGAASRYAERAADRGLIGIVMANTRPLMPAPGGRERVVGNNPLAVAVPTASGDAVSFDMATSQAAMGKIRHAAAAASSIPEDWATDEEGVPTTDPTAAIAGMLLPAGGAKGFGLALVIDLLSGLLAGGGWGDDVTPLFGDPSVPYNSSQLFVALDPSFFGDGAVFLDQANRAVQRVRESAPIVATEPARVPGDARRSSIDRHRQTVPVAAPVLARLLEMAATHGVDTGQFDDLPAHLAL